MATINQIKIQREAAEADQRKIRQAITKLEESMNTLRSLNANASGMSGETGSAIVEQSTRLINQISAMINENLNTSIQKIEQGVGVVGIDNLPGGGHGCETAHRIRIISVHSNVLINLHRTADLGGRVVRKVDREAVGIGDVVAAIVFDARLQRRCQLCGTGGIEVLAEVDEIDLINSCLRREFSCDAADIGDLLEIIALDGTRDLF